MFHFSESSYESSHQIDLNEVGVLQVEYNSRYGKLKEMAHVACLTNLISQPSLESLPFSILLINDEGSKS